MLYTEYLLQYNFSVKVYLYCKFLEINVSEMKDSYYIENLLKDFEHVSNSFYISLCEYQNKFINYVYNANVYKENAILKSGSKLKNIYTNANKNNVFEAILSGYPGAIGLSFDMINEFDKKNKEDNKDKLLNKMYNDFSKVDKDYEVMRRLIVNIDKMYNSPIDIVKKDGELYMRYLSK